MFFKFFFWIEPIPSKDISYLIYPVPIVIDLDEVSNEIAPLFYTYNFKDMGNPKMCNLISEDKTPKSLAGTPII